MEIWGSAGFSIGTVLIRLAQSVPTCTCIYMYIHINMYELFLDMVCE